MDLKSLEREPPARDVPHQRESAVTEVGQIVDRRAADVHRKRPAWRSCEVSHLSSSRVIEANHCSKLRQPCLMLPRREPSTSLKSPRLTVWRRPGPSAGTTRRPTASTGPRPARTSTASTPPRPRSRANCTSATSSATPRATSWRDSGACGARTSFTPWAGTTTASRPSGASRTTTGCAVTRRCPTTPTSPLRRSPATEKLAISRRNFVELCLLLTAVDEEAFKRLWRYLGVSVDWSLEYTTISPHAQAICQRGFLDMLERGDVYSSVAPTLWDIDFRTAVSQAELEDRERPGTYHRRRLLAQRRPGHHRDRDDTTRDAPELRCARRPPRRRALRARSSAPRSLTPLFKVEVPVVAHELADPDKGSGIAMICTFGDTTDVTWWRELQPPDPRADWARRALPARRLHLR